MASENKIDPEIIDPYIYIYNYVQNIKQNDFQTNYRPLEDVATATK